MKAARAPKKNAAEIPGVQMTVNKVEVERVSVVSSKPFEAVVQSVKAGIGQLPIIPFRRSWPLTLDCSVSFGAD